MNQAQTDNEESRLGYGILALMVAGAIFGGLLQNAVSTVLPDIMADTGVSVGMAQWLVSSFQLCLGIVIPLVAFFVRRFDIRALYLMSMTLFTAGTFLVAAAPNFELIFLGRILEGVGAGLSFPLVQIVVFQNYPRERWATIMGVVGLAFGFAPNVGPSIAGICAENWGWQSMFWITGAGCSLVTLLMILFLPRLSTNDPASPLDWPSVILSSLAFGGMLMGLTNSTDSGVISANALVPLAVGIICLVAFLVRQRRIPNPLWNLDSFRNRDFTAGTIMVCLLFTAFIGVTLVLPLGMQKAGGFSAFEAGLALLPGAVAALIMNPLSGIWMDHRGTRGIVCFGAILLVVGTVPLVRLGEMDNLALIMTLQGIRAFGISSLIQPLSTWSVRTLERNLISDGTSISNTVRQVAASFGVSVSVLLMSIGGATGSVSAFGVDVAMAFSLACCVILLALSFVFVRK